jgi:superoxide dismutase, Cu-Zn family
VAHIALFSAGTDLASHQLHLVVDEDGRMAHKTRPIRSLRRRHSPAGSDLAKLPRFQAASDGLLAVALAACLLTMGCRPNVPGEEDADPPTDPQVLRFLAQAEAQPTEPRTGRLGAPEARARADILPVPGSDAQGFAEITETERGVDIHVEMSGLEPGPHGFHVHEFGDCSDPGTTAGDHYNPDGTPHGSPEDPPTARHAGDLGNLDADERGYAQQSLRVDGLALTGPRGVLDRALIVHQGEDDFETQPDGDAGDPTACGVIYSVEGEDERPPV